MAKKMKWEKGYSSYVFAWAIRNERSDKWWLCRWSEPTREMLEKRGKPSPEACIVRVWLSLDNPNKVPADDR